MRKLLFLIALTFSVLTVTPTVTLAQTNPQVEVVVDESGADQGSPFQVLKSYFIKGGWIFMSFVLACLILGLALIIERIITLNLATANTDELLEKVDNALAKGDTNEALDVCRATPGPAASVLYQGLSKSDQGLVAVEKSIDAYGSVQMGLLEKGLSWISLFISIAPMLGFMGTVIGMVKAFQQIATTGDVSPKAMAGNIQLALITTLFGLVTAIILQVFYNYLISKVDGLVNDMENTSISLVDMLAKYSK